MQSGISVSPDLSSAFQTFLQTPSQRGLLAGISKETLVPVAALPSQSSDFYDDLAVLAQHLQPNAALYILLRRTSALNGLVAVTYVPNAAPVRQKMLFASTRLSLVRELGTEHFGETVFATMPEELSADGWRKHEKHVASENPLTEEERSLEGIKAAEAMESGGMERRDLTGPSKEKELAKVGEEAQDALRGFVEGRGGNLVQLRADMKTETVHVDSISEVTPASLGATINSQEPRYSFYRHSASSPSEAPIVFIYTCPATSKVREKMFYAAAKRGVHTWAERNLGMTIAKRLEASDPDEISEATINEEFQPKQETRSAFAKPKKPGRR